MGNPQGMYKDANEEHMGIPIQKFFWVAAQVLSHGAGRSVREATNSYIGGKFTHCGTKFSSEAPELSQAEIDSVPGAAASHTA